MIRTLDQITLLFIRIAEEITGAILHTCSRLSGQAKKYQAESARREAESAAFMEAYWAEELDKMMADLDGSDFDDEDI